MSRLPKVALVCVHNSCRSPIAEVLGYHLAADTLVDNFCNTAAANLYF